MTPYEILKSATDAQLELNPNSNFLKANPILHISMVIIERLTRLSKEKEAYYMASDGKSVKPVLEWDIENYIRVNEQEKATFAKARELHLIS